MCKQNDVLVLYDAASNLTGRKVTIRAYQYLIFGSWKSLYGV